MVAVSPAPKQYRVLRSFKGDRTYAPGEIITITPAWPYHRTTNLTNQRYLEPLAPQSDPNRKDRTNA